MKLLITKFIAILIFVLFFFPQIALAAAPVIKGLVKTVTGAVIPGVWVKWQDNSNQSKWGRLTDEGQPGVVAPSPRNNNYPGRVCGGWWADDADDWNWAPCCSDINGNDVVCPAYSNVRYVQTQTQVGSTTATPSTLNYTTKYYSGDNPSNFIFPSWSGDGSGNDVCLGNNCEYVLQGLTQNERVLQVDRMIDTNLNMSNDTYQATTYPASARTAGALTNLRNGSYETFNCYSNPHTIAPVPAFWQSYLGSYSPSSASFAYLGNSQVAQDVNFTYIPDPACYISFDITPASAVSGTNVTVDVIQMFTNTDWNYVGLYVDDTKATGGTIIANPIGSINPYRYRWVIPAGPAGPHNLQFRIHDTSEGYSGSAPNRTCAAMSLTSFTTTAPTAPAITGLKINNASDSQTGGFTGTANVAGKQSGAQGGSNWLNPMKITLNATSGSNPISNYYVAFYDQASVSNTPFSNSGTFLADVKAKINSDPKNGFLLRYEVGPPVKYYVWDYSASNWSDITNNYLGKLVCGSAGCDTQLYYKAFPGNTLGIPSNPSLANSWTIQFDKNFESKKMYTAGYVEDNNSVNRLSGFQADIPPTSSP